MLINNIFNNWDDDNINDFWLNNKIVDCSNKTVIKTKKILK